MIEKYFKDYGESDAIFNPIPSYLDDWGIELKSIVKNSKREKGINLFEQYYQKEVSDKLSQLFQSPQIYSVKLPLISKPNNNHQGRQLCLFRNGFYLALSSFLSGNLDILDEDKKDITNTYINFLINNKDINNINKYFEAIANTKIKRIEDVEKLKQDSKYYKYAIKDYFPYNQQMSFNTFLSKTKTLAQDMANGLHQLGDFFDKPLDYSELYNCFDPDTFYLLMAKVIYEVNLEWEEKFHCLCNNYGYLIEYCDACEKAIKEDKRYNPTIDYISKDGKTKRYTRRDVMEQIKVLLAKHPEAKPILLPDLKDDKAYLNIDLVNKISKLYQGQTNVNWEMLPKGKGIKRGEISSNRESSSNDKSSVIADVNERINIIEQSGFIGTPIRGLNTFNGYYAFVYPSGIVVLEKFWENEENLTPATGCATYIMNIDNFIEMSKHSRTTLIEYMRILPDIAVKRIFHTTNDNWKQNFFKEIEGTYRLDDAINFLNNLRNGELKHE